MSATYYRYRRFALDRLADLLLIAIILLVLFPIFWMIVNSLRTNQEILTAAALFPEKPQFHNYQDLWAQVDFGLYFRNSLIVCGVTTLIVSFLATLSGYALARFRFPGADAFGLAVLGTQLIPGILFLLPLYGNFILIKKRLGIPLVGTNFGAIVLYTAFFLPLSLWILRSFFATIPRDLEEAALIDGATPFGAFWRIALPLARPGIVATAIYVFLAAWDELLFAWVLNVNTIPVGIRLFVGQYTNRFDLMSAAAVVSTIPVLVIFFLLQRQMISGLTAGAIK
ncbi:MAG: carbohydrate ABC transporter permease [Chloroflexi bacterium]|nr:carbohydrate ABC transporter permease [Chloroflexota bacterium]